MKFSNVQRSMIFIMAIFSLVLFWGGSCGGGDSTPGAYSYNAAIATMGGTYTSNVIDINYYVSVTTNKPGSVPLAPGFGDVYSLVEYSTNSGVRYQLCHNTAGNPGDYFTFLEAPSTQEAVFHWDVDRDLGVGVNVDSCIIRVRIFHASDDPCTDPPMDVEGSEEFVIALGGGTTDCGIPPAIITESVDNATDELAYNFTFDAIDGYGDLTWSLGTPLNNEMVTGLSLTPYGILTGTPVVQGEYKGTNLQLDLDVWVTDSCPEGERSDNAVFLMTIFPQEPVCAAPPEFDPEQTLPDGTEGEVYDGHTLVLSVPGEGAVIFTITMGSLPDGIVLNSTTGVISGTPDAGTAGLYPITFLVTDSCETPQTGSISLEMTIEEAAFVCDPAPVITTEGLADGVQGDPYEVTMAASDGHGALTWELDGTLPAGLTFTAAGVLSGTPTEFGTFEDLYITVLDSCPEQQSDTEIYTLVIAESAPVCADPPVITTYELDAGTEAQVGYSCALAADDGELPLIWTLEAGTLPSSLTFGTDGVISGDLDCGTPGEYPITVRVTDSCEDPAPQYDEEDFTLYVGAQVCVLLDIDDYQIVPDAMVEQSYMYMFTCTGGFGDITWELTSGTLPTGIELVSGRLVGIPATSTEGDYPLTILATDSCCTPQTDEFSFTLHVDPLSRCLEEPVEVHTFCIDCPDIIAYHGVEDVPVYLVQPAMSLLFPADIEIVITYDETLVSIPAVLPGPIVQDVLGFNAVIDTSSVTITYVGMPLSMTGVFCYLTMININEDSTDLFTPIITVNVLNDHLAAPIDNATDTCEILVEGVDI